MTDNLKAPKAFKIEAKEDATTIYLYDAIGDYMGVSAQEFVKSLNDIKSKTIHLRINSPGGDVFEGRAIQTALKQHKAEIVAHIDGVAASAATFVALGADRVEMSKGGFFMIHKAWTMQLGNADEMRETANLLDKIDNSIVADYVGKTGASAEDVQAWMASETWFSADEALEHGFIDAIFEGESAKNQFNLSAYQNAPKALTEQPEPDAALLLRNQLERRLTLIEKLG